ncbi:hypothetical protein KKD61_00855 [Patescibacteria group bacterium]|nr:hypothetical protein [Patescibacteria group bacterium]
MKKKKKLPIQSIAILLGLTIILPIIVWSLPKIQEWRKAAAGKPADIIIDTARPGGIIKADLWQNFSQGGEEAKDMLAPVISEVADLKPKLIRIDHLFDHHVKVNGNQYDFSQLDNAVNSILQTGAKPMLSLSYMPQSLSKDNNVTSEPKDWSSWRKLVAAAVSRYSGKNGLNIDGVYYEVWNEPDLFGNWHYGREKNYLNLYQQTLTAVQGLSNVNSFKIGGPATTGFYPNWIKALLSFCHQKQLRIDFVSWHRYTENIPDYSQDFEKLNRILTDYPEFFSIERIITEFGPDSENSPWYDQQIGAIHSLSAVISLIGKVHRIFTFEIKDGPDPAGNLYWGRWGLLTHESKGVVKKPRYFAYQFLNQIDGLPRLPLDGEGTWVSAIAVKDGAKIKILAVNYDPKEKNYQSVPITLKNLVPGDYQVKTNYFMGRETIVNETINENSVTRSLILPPNSAAIIEWIKI